MYVSLLSCREYIRTIKNATVVLNSMLQMEDCHVFIIFVLLSILTYLESASLVDQKQI